MLTSKKRHIKIFTTILNWLADANQLIFPQTCSVCGNRLLKEETVFCTSCHSKLPFTHIKGKRGNNLEKIFWGKFPIERTNSLLKYQSGADSTRIISRLKYGNRPQFGKYLGELMAYDLIQTDFFQDIDCIIPIPLAAKRERERGYNQSHELALGIAKVTGLRIENSVIKRQKSNPTQTKLNFNERITNVSGIFALCRPELIENKHILLVDDVMTSGATLTSCAQELSKAKGVRISILTLFTAHSIIGPSLDSLAKNHKK